MWRIVRSLAIPGGVPGPEPGLGKVPVMANRREGGAAVCVAVLGGHDQHEHAIAEPFDDVEVAGAVVAGGDDCNLTLTHSVHFPSNSVRDGD